MNVVHLTASPFFGGPERQMLGLALALPDEHRSIFMSYSERGLCRPFLERLSREGFEAIELRHNAPRMSSAVKEVTGHLRRFRADVLCCHGYKPDIFGLLAARRVGIPAVAVSRGWTAATLKVRLYDWLDRLSLHAMDRVVCVSEGQAAKVRRIGVSERHIVVIPNAVDAHRFGPREPRVRQQLESLFPKKPRWLVGAAGRLSPEKGFDVLIDAASLVVKQNPNVGFVIFGDGPLREELAARAARQNLGECFVMPGFHGDLDRFLPCLDAVVLPSFTEGMPNIVLEALAARVPVIATDVGGTPELVEDGVTGRLVAPGDRTMLAERINGLLGDEHERRRMCMCGFARVSDGFTFQAQAAAYEQLFGQLGQASERIKRRRQIRKPAATSAGR